MEPMKILALGASKNTGYFTAVRLLGEMRDRRTSLELV